MFRGFLFSTFALNRRYMGLVAVTFRTTRFCITAFSNTVGDSP
jgi:hypothetical protein